MRRTGWSVYTYAANYRAGGATIGRRRRRRAQAHAPIFLPFNDCNMADLDLAELHRFAATLAIDAGSYLRDQALIRSQRGPASAYDLELTIKENAADLVTKADHHAEQMISNAIRERYPDHRSVPARWRTVHSCSVELTPVLTWQDHRRGDILCWTGEAVLTRRRADMDHRSSGRHC